jgi:hypothetical protein
MELGLDVFSEPAPAAAGEDVAGPVVRCRPQVSMSIIRFDESKHCRDSGGKFAAKGLAVADDAVSFADDSQEVWHDPGIPAPQANDLEKVASVPSIVEAGATTSDGVASALNMNERQGTYYSDAARYLGLVEAHEDASGLSQLSVTERGHDMLASGAPAEQTEYVAAVAARSPAVQILDEEGEDALADYYGREYGTGENTTARRVASARAWSGQAHDPSTAADRATDWDGQVSTRLEHASELSRRRIDEAQRTSRPTAKVCPQCFMQLPATGICDECAA